MKIELNKMKIELNKIKIRDLVDGFENDEENGVVGYHGNLDIRPKYQREFIYKDEQQKAVIDTIKKGFPLNVMYWVKIDKDRYELLDGQQRTMSICQFYKGNLWAIWNGTMLTYDNLTDDQKELFLNYELTVYICEGTDSEKLEWFKTINIAGEKLTEQEIRNAVFAGDWVSDLKKKFSKSNGVAVLKAKDFMAGSPIRQDYLETVLSWIAKSKDGVEIEKYMAQNQKKENADVEWQYFQNVINWVIMLFPNYRKEMKGLEWGFFYNRYKAETENNPEKYTATKLEQRIQELISDDDVQNYRGIYEYLFSNDWHKLGIRQFDSRTKRKIYEKEKGICPLCGKHFEIEQMEADHITPWAKGGHTVEENCQVICLECNRRKSDK